MRAVFQPPASIVSVVLAPRAVSSEARPTRPECPVIRPSMLADLAAAVRCSGVTMMPALLMRMSIFGCEARIVATAALTKVLRSEVELDDFGDASECAVSETGLLTVSDRAAAAVQRLVAMSYKATSVASARAGAARSRMVGEAARLPAAWRRLLPATRG